MNIAQDMVQVFLKRNFVSVLELKDKFIKYNTVKWIFKEIFTS